PVLLVSCASCSRCLLRSVAGPANSTGVGHQIAAPVTVRKRPGAQEPQENKRRGAVLVLKNQRLLSSWSPAPPALVVSCDPWQAPRTATGVGHQIAAPVTDRKRPGAQEPQENKRQGAVLVLK